MSETLALARLAVTKSRFVFAVTASTLTIGLIAFVALRPEGNPTGREDVGFAVGALCSALLPAAFASLLMFDYGIETDLSRPSSGCNHWLLRMPIKAWKIALVPVVLKSLWISMLWVILVAALRLTGTDRMPIIAPCLAISGSAIWFMVIGWQPFRSGWHRIIALGVAAPTIYCLIAASGSAPFWEPVVWRSTAVVVSNVVAVIAYAGAVGAAIQSVGVARVASFGLIPAEGRVATKKIESVGIRDFGGPWRALILKDMIKNRRRVFITWLAVVLPCICFFAFVVPLNAASAVFVFFAFSYLGAIAASQSGGEEDNPLQLPTYLAAAPIKTSTISWARILSTTSVIAVVYGNVLLVLAGWACWPSNRETWMEWAGNVSRAIDTPGADPFWVGLRVSAAIVLGWSVFFLGRIAAFGWIGMTGRKWFGVLMSFVSGGIVLVPLGLFLAWFSRQPNWQTTQQTAIKSLDWLPWIVATLLIAKGMACVGVAWRVHQEKIVGTRELGIVACSWLGLVLAVSFVLTALIPDPRFNWLWCVSVTVACVPLARILLGPLALAWNRHR